MRAPLYRSTDGLIAGVCVGLAEHLGVGVHWVRLAMVALVLLSGAGVFLYGWLWVFVPTTADRGNGDPRRSGPAAFMADVGPEQGPPTAEVPEDDGRPRHPATASFLDARAWHRRTLDAGRKEILLGAGLLLVASVLVVQLLGVQVEWRLLVPVAAVVVGAALAWSQLDAVRRARMMNRAGVVQAGGPLRLFAGMVLVVAGVLVAISSSGSWSLTMATLVAVLAVLAGVGLVLAPWVLTFWRDLESERAARVRESERAEIAAHLHDSVLQTLALIQNHAGSETEVVRLARAQERELRQWLFADPVEGPGSLAERLRIIAGEIEDHYGYPVEVVTVGDAVPGPAEDALAQAAREAILNAAKHARTPVSVYLEVGEPAVEVFVRDRGAGFDQHAVPPDRLGVRESIHGRMRRHGGSSEVRSDEDGTEVRLRLPHPEHATV